MTPLRFDDVSRVLPDLVELQPVLDHLLAGSQPDPSRRWAASSELDAAGARLVVPDRWSEAAEELAEREGAHLAHVYHFVLEAVACLERSDFAGGARALLDAAALEESRNRPGRAEAYAASATRAARRSRDPVLLGLALRRQARAARGGGRLPEAERLYRSGYETARATGDAAGAAEGAIGAGNVLEEQARWPESETWYRTALELVGSTEEATPELWHALLNLHVVARSQGHVDESLDWLRRAEDVAEAMEDRWAPALLANARGQLHMARGDFERAKSCFEQALSEPANAWARVNFRLNLGEALLAAGHTLDAAEAVREAEREALVTGVTGKLPEVYRLLGRIAAARGNADSVVLFERALEIVRERGLPPIEEAVTLQAYARELQDTDPERAEAMRQRASELYGALGIAGMRDPFSATFGASDFPTDDQHDTGSGREQEERGDES